MRAKLSTIVSSVSKRNVAFTGIELFRVMAASGFHNLAVKVNDVCAACLLMEVINVLSNDGNLEHLLKLTQGKMCRVRFSGPHRLAALIVEPENPFRVFFPPFWSRYQSNGLALPQTSWSAKDGEPAFSTYPCPGEYDHMSITHNASSGLCEDVTQA
jgi:hypothetical protein